GGELPGLIISALSAGNQPLTWQDFSAETAYKELITHTFVKLQKSIVKHRTAIIASIEDGLSNGRVESMNTKIRLMTRIAFGFTSPDVLIALAMFSVGGHKPVLPGRFNPRKSQESR
ncbi:transposase, partial [Cryobacterium glaciale]|uniref:transposase n=1 Tax=Cryobacterium glaciale TaxID=1259145 RepID=UPI001F546AEB